MRARLILGLLLGICSTLASAAIGGAVAGALGGGMGFDELSNFLVGVLLGGAAGLGGAIWLARTLSDRALRAVTASAVIAALLLFGFVAWRVQQQAMGA